MGKNKGQPSGSKKNTSKMLPRRERISGNKRKRTQQPLHVSARIQKNTITIVITMVI
jgi:hypothetical protein